MQNSFLQKVVLIIIAGALTAGVIEFYKVFVVGGMKAVSSKPATLAEPTATPRRF